MDVKLGQRYGFIRPNDGTGAFHFIAEICNLVNLNWQDVKVVQQLDPGYSKVGYIYHSVRVTDGSWTFLEGQDAPVTDQIKE